MGTIWRAWNTQLDMPVAVKVMAPAVAQLPGFVARFVLEAKSAAKIRSPNVVTVFEHGVHQGLPYMVMELLEGEDLHARLKREQHLSLAATSRIVREVCKALQRAHTLNIVHRDLKPANVFLVRDGDEEVAKVLDFGIAKITSADASRITATGQLLGTPHYMSPEQVRAPKQVDHRADLWAVGAITYRCLTGHLPFEGNMLELVQQILHDPAPSATKAAPHLPAAVDAFFQKALAQAPDRRFQSARELSDALLVIAGSDPSAEAMVPGKGAPEPDDLSTVTDALLASAGSDPSAEAMAPSKGTVEPDELSTVTDALLASAGSYPSAEAMAPSKGTVEPDELSTVLMDRSTRPIESGSKPTVPMPQVARPAAAPGSFAGAESAATPLRPPLEPTAPMDVPELRRESAAPGSLDAWDSQVGAARRRSPLVWIVVALVLAALVVAVWAHFAGRPPGP